MASSRSSSLCGSELSWPNRYTRTAMSQRYDPLARTQSGNDVSPASRQSPSQLVEMLTALKEEQAGLFRNADASHVTRLEREFNQLRASTLPAQDMLSQSLPTTGASKTQGDVGLAALLERELQAYSGTQSLNTSSTERGRVAPTNPRYRSQSVDPHVSLIGQTKADWQSNADLRSTQTTPSISPFSQWQKELEKKELALQKAREDLCCKACGRSSEDLSKLEEEKAACVAAHERDVAALESMLKSLMDENEKLKQALGAKLGETPPTLESGSMYEDVRKDMISNLMHSGISNIPSTPKSNGSSEFEPEAEANSLDTSRASIDANRTATPPYTSSMPSTV